VDVDEGGVEMRETVRDRILYGVGLWLPDVASWLDDLVPPVPKNEINRRAENQQQWRDQ